MTAKDCLDMCIRRLRRNVYTAHYNRHAHWLAVDRVRLDRYRARALAVGTSKWGAWALNDIENMLIAAEESTTYQQIV